MRLSRKRRTQENDGHECVVSSQEMQRLRWPNVISTTWAIKKKSNSIFRARVNAQQIDGENNNSDNISSPVTKEATICNFLVLSVIFRLTYELIYVKGTFFYGNFQDEKPIFMNFLKDLNSTIEEMYYSYYYERSMG